MKDGMITKYFRRPSVAARQLDHLRQEEEAALRRDTLAKRVRWLAVQTSAGANWCYGGAVKLVQFPAYAFDLLDRYEKPDHAKIGPFLVSQELVAICAWDVIKNNRPLQPSVVIIIAVLSFASASLMRYFVSKAQWKASSEDKTSSTTVDVTVRQIQERRNAADGMEATP